MVFSVDYHYLSISTALAIIRLCPRTNASMRAWFATGVTTVLTAATRPSAPLVTQVTRVIQVTRVTLVTQDTTVVTLVATPAIAQLLRNQKQAKAKSKDQEADKIIPPQYQSFQRHGAFFTFI